MKRFELKSLQSEFPNVKVTSSEVAYDVIRKFYGDDIDIFESCFILLLNNANVTIGYAKISQGGITGTVVDTRIIAKYAIESLATAVILAHNHPSGNLKPSNADIEVTKKIEAGLKIFDITLLDHMIITDKGFSLINKN
jgi:DNA repair protein RadC